MKIGYYVMHLRTEARVATLERLLRAFEHETPTVVEDPYRAGAWHTARRCWNQGLDDGCDWIVVLNDDALPCRDFEDRVRDALAERDEQDPVCFYTAHPDASTVPPLRWYTTHDDLVGVGCALSRQSAIDFLAWCKEHDGEFEGFSDDGRINLWAMSQGRLIYTTVPSLVEHQLPNESTVPWSSSEGRRAVVPPEDEPPAIAPAGACHLGRARYGNHWEMLFRVQPVDDLAIERAYEIERNGIPVDARPHVFIAMPAYVMPETAVRASVEANVRDLRAHGYEATVFESPGDSLVTRGRHGLSHEFLRSTATHFLQWDADIECLAPNAVRGMVESGRPIVGGAYPWRDGSGRVVCNPLPESIGVGKLQIDTKAKCIKVREVGTGFLMVSRTCLVNLMATHPELMYEADIEPFVGAPMWSLFDAALEMGPHGRKRYASEDWRFCTLAREAGYDVAVYYPPKFRHWGKFPHTGHIIEAWGLNRPEPKRQEPEAAE